jgi:hypothetical protein
MNPLEDQGPTHISSRSQGDLIDRNQGFSESQGPSRSLLPRLCWPESGVASPLRASVRGLRDPLAFPAVFHSSPSPGLSMPQVLP